MDPPQKGTVEAYTTSYSQEHTQQQGPHRYPNVYPPEAAQQPATGYPVIPGADGSHSAMLHSTWAPMPGLASGPSGPSAPPYPGPGQAPTIITADTANVYQPLLAPQSAMIAVFPSDYEPPGYVTCRHCGQIVLPEPKHVSGGCTFLLALGFCFIGCWPLACLPFCCQGTKDTMFLCPACQRELYRYKRGPC